MPCGAVWQAMGELGWALIRGGLYAIGFMVVIAVLGLIVSPWVILAFPAALLVGFAFGAVGMEEWMVFFRDSEGNLVALAEGRRA